VNRPVRLALGLLVALAVTGATVALSRAPYPTGQGSDALLRLSWSGRPERIERCRELTDAELAERPAHMRRRLECEGRSALRGAGRVDGRAARWTRSLAAASAATGRFTCWGAPARAGRPRDRSRGETHRRGGRGGRGDRGRAGGGGGGRANLAIATRGSGGAETGAAGGASARLTLTHRWCWRREGSSWSPTIRPAGGSSP
jgi:hypothetical protein